VANEWAESTLHALTRRGRRSGAARAAVVELLGGQSCCLTAQEIYDTLRDRRRPVGLASIYRTLDQLSSEGFVQKIELGAGTTRYEPVQPGGEHHHHLVCDACGKVEAFADDRLERALHRVENETGYRVAAHDVVLRGECSDCR
jgi:Fur family transcriptional regulator, ferric uptake regulator